MKAVFTVVVFIAACFCGLSLFSFSQDENDEIPAICVYTEEIGLVREPKSRLIMAAWESGRVIWSEDQAEGSGQLRQGEVPPRKISDALNCIQRDSFFSTPALRRELAGPDSTVITILVKIDDQLLKVRTAHELIEASGLDYVSNDGIFPLEGESRLEVLQNEPAEFLVFRIAWAELRQKTQSLIPTQSEIYESEFSVEDLVAKLSPVK